MLGGMSPDEGGATRSVSVWRRQGQLRDIISRPAKPTPDANPDQTGRTGRLGDWVPRGIARGNNGGLTISAFLI